MIAIQRRQIVSLFQDEDLQLVRIIAKADLLITNLELFSVAREESKYPSLEIARHPHTKTEWMQSKYNVYISVR
jgi:hypothetical protein